MRLYLGMHRPTRPTLAAALLAALAVLPACDTESNEAFDSTRNYTLYTPPMYFGVCPTYICGSNAGVAGALSFNLDRETTLDGKAFAEAYDSNGVVVEVSVEANQLVVRDNEGQVLPPESMIGVEIVLVDVETQERTHLHLDGYDPVGASSLQFEGVVYPTYLFTYRNSEDPAADRTPLCASHPWYDDPGEGYQPETNYAIMIQNEAYDWWGNAVPGIDEGPAGSSQWLTIGCSGGAFSKKILMGYDSNNHVDVRPTRGQNATMMNMLTARYCGGQSHTVTGVPLAWQNAWEWFDAPDGMVEAIWDENGVVCLDTPRYANRGAVENECGPIPGCDDVDPGEHHLSSYIPFE